MLSHTNSTDNGGGGCREYLWNVNRLYWHILLYSRSVWGIKKKDCLIYIAKPKLGSFIYNRVVCPLYSVIFPERVSVLDGGKVFRFLLVVIYRIWTGDWKCIVCIVHSKAQWLCNWEEIKMKQCLFETCEIYQGIFCERTCSHSVAIPPLKVCVFNIMSSLPI